MMIVSFAGFREGSHVFFMMTLEEGKKVEVFGGSLVPELE